MARNLTENLYLDGPQIARKTFDSDNDAFRIVLAEATGMAVELSAADGDNIATKALSSSTKVSLTNASTGVVVPATSCDGYKNFNLYSKTTSTIVDSQVLTLEISPHDTDDIWISTALTVTPSITNGISVMGTSLSNVVARRARVSIGAAVTSGTFDLYLVQSG